MCLLLSSDAALLAYGELGPARDGQWSVTCGCVYFSSAGASAVSMGTSGLFREEESQVSMKISEYTLKSQSCI